MARTDGSYTDERPLPRRGGGLRLRWFLLPVLLVAVWFAPTLVGMTPLRQTILDAAVPELQGNATIGSASLGWLSPIVARDVVWRDPDGRTLAEIRTVRLERSVWSLLTDSRSIGTIHFVDPKLKILLREDGSNFEDAIAPFLAKPPSGERVELGLALENGAIELVDGMQQLAWQFEAVDASVIFAASADEASQAKLAARIHDAQGEPRAIEASFAWHPIAAQPQPAEPGGELAVKGTGVPLALLRPIVRRLAPGADLGGVATCELTWSYNADFSQQTLKVAQLSGQDLLLAAPQWLGSDALRTARLAASGDILVTGEQLRLNGVRVETDFARLSASGQTQTSGWTTAPIGTTLMSTLASDDYDLRAEVDVARLAAQLPATLRIREGTEITSGSITLNLASRSQGKRRRWDGELRTSALAAMQGGREIIWDKPITITLAAQQAASGPVIEQLTCASSFLELQARGTLDRGELDAAGDLGQLLAEVNRFVDLDDIRLAGKLVAGLGWRRQGESAFEAQGQAQVTDFTLIVPGQQPWREEQVTCDLSLAGAADAGGLRHVREARLKVVAGEDELEAELMEPLVSLTWEMPLPLTITGQGELGRWLPRVQAWLPITVERAAGSIHLVAQIVAASDEWQVRQMALDVEGLQLQLLGLNIREDETRIAGDLLWQSREQQLRSDSLTVATSALAFRAERLAIEPRTSGMAVSGEIGYRADLERLGSWLIAPGTTPDRKWSGMTDGRVRFTHQGNVTQAKWTAEFENVALSRRVQPARAATPLSPVAANGGGWELRWREERLVGNGQGELDHGRNRLTATNFSIVSDTLGVSARGVIDALTTRPVIDLSGEISYDLRKFWSAFCESPLSPTWAYGLDRDIQVAGVGKRPFKLRGTLPTRASVASQDPRAPATVKLVWPDDLQGSAGITWSTAQVYGLPIGGGSLDGALEKGVVNFAPIDLAVSEGRIKAWPRIVLGHDPMVFQLAKGSRVEQLQITPQMCQTWLKYVAPLLADATRAEGKFSANVEGATVPLLQPEYADARGTLTVHGARVGPGPLSEQYVLLARQVRSVLERKPLDGSFRAADVEWLTLPQQEVAIEAAAGRVYHRGLQITIGDTTLVTSGSVGVADQTLGLLVEVPIREEWIAKDRMLSGLRGQSLKIPISGTIQRPQPDPRALQQLAAQMVQGAAGSLIEKGLQEGLDKLLGPRRPTP